MIYLTPNMRAYPPLCLETHRLIMKDRLIAKMVETAKKQRASQRRRATMCLPLVAVLVSCAPVDRGECLKTEVRPMWTQFILVGKSIIPIVHPASNVCVEWEFPEGRPS